MNYDLAQIAGQFQIVGEVTAAEPYGTGHINDTFVIACRDEGGERRYALQRINHNVFKDPPGMMNNIIRVTSHIRNRLKASEANDLARRVLTVVPTRTGKGYYQDAEGNYWRMYFFIEGVQTYDVLETLEQAYEAARAFGKFQSYLSDLPDPPLVETIPDFHNTPQRLQTFLSVLEEDPCSRARTAREEIGFIHQRAGICSVLLDLAALDKIPVRVTHNDTKINNVLFDSDKQEGICVIDLDTVMPGLSLYDFGDMVRTATCRAAEDERDLAKIHMDITFFEQLVRGYVRETADFLTKAEKEHLGFAGKLITFEQMIRFLTDYLAGDVYYKTHRPGHNLDRARTQMKLVQSIEEQEEQMNRLTEELLLKQS